MSAATEFLLQYYGENNRSITAQYLQSIESSDGSVSDEHSAIFRVHQLLGEFETCVCNDIFLSIDKLAAIQELLDSSRSLIKRHSKAHFLLMSEYRQARSRVTAELRGMIETAVQFNRPHQLTIQQRTTHKGQFVKLKDLLDHLQSMELLSEYLDHFLHNILLPEFIQPILRDPQQCQLQINATTYASTCRLICGAAASTTQSLTTTFNRLQELSEFTHKFFDSMLLVVPWFHGRLMELIRPVVLAGAEPSSGRLSADKIAQFSSALLEFERHMINNGWQMEGRMEWTELVQSLSASLQSKRRQELIASVRGIIVNNRDLQSVQVSDFSERGGVKIKGMSNPAHGAGGKGAKSGKGGGGGYIDSDLSLPTMLVSTTTQCLVEMAYQHADQMLQSKDDSERIEAYYAARDIVDCWRAMMPVVHGQRIAHEPVAAALFFNDCQYWDYHLRTMTYPAFSSETLPPPLRQTCSMVDLIPLVRRLGDYHIRLQLTCQRDEIKQLIGVLRDFDGENDSELHQRIEGDLSRLSYKLSSLSQSWKSILGRDYFLKFFGLLLGVLVDDLIEWLTVIDKRLSASESLSAAQLAEERYRVKYWIDRFIISQVDQWMQVFVEENGQRTHRMQPSPISKFVPKWDLFIGLSRQFMKSNSMKRAPDNPVFSC